MEKVKLGGMWAAAILGAAVAANIGVIGQPVAEGLFYGLLIGAAVSLGQSPCRAC